MTVKDFILQNIEQYPDSIIHVAMKACNVSRAAVYKQIQGLIADGIIYRKKRGHYCLASKTDKKYRFSLSDKLQEDIICRKYFDAFFENLPRNIYDICIYGFTEILNNAIDHSEGSIVEIHTFMHEGSVIIEICDDGIGIFTKIRNAFHLDDDRESLFQLTKGKLTTDPDNHSGEGIFFTSRSFDEFTIVSGDLLYYKNILEDDWYMETRHNKFSGTVVTMTISVESERGLSDAFSMYAQDAEKFNKTHIVVALAKRKEERYVSRSQAKRILANLEKFEHVILDFEKVSVVGQAFVDEVFRVYKKRNPNINIEYVNANDDIEFMIKRTIMDNNEYFSPPFL